MSNAIDIPELTRQVGLEELAGWAFDAGFQEKDVLRYNASSNSLGAMIHSGHFGERELGTVVLKQGN